MGKEVKIIPPEGYEIDRENSTLDCIKFKSITPPVKRWRDGNHDVNGWYVGSRSPLVFETFKWKNARNIFATEKQAKSAFAMAQISQIMANDERFGGVVTDEEWYSDHLYKYTLTRCNNCISSNMSISMYHLLAFHTGEQRDLFLKENEDLVKDYLMID